MIKFIANYSVSHPNIHPSSIEELIDYCSSKELLGFDTETTSLDPLEAKINMLQIGDEEVQFVVDCRTVDVSPVFEILQNPKITKVLTNAKYDASVVKTNWNINLRNIRDCMLQNMTIFCGLKQEKGFHGLEGMARYYNVYEFAKETTDSDNISKNTRVSMMESEIYNAEEIHYGANDVWIPIKIDRKQREISKKLDCFNIDNKLFDLEGNFSAVLADLEVNGMPFNSKDWEKIALINSVKEDDIRDELDDLGLELGFEEVNWNSPKQVVEVFKKAGVNTKIIDKNKSTKTNKIYKDSVGRVHIEKYRNKFHIVDTYLRYKEIAKKLGTYGTKFIEKFNRNERIHAKYFQILNTGRTSSNNPNIQQIPREDKYRKCFNVKEGKSLVVADYSQQELRILAEYADEPTMLAEFNRTDVKPDIHSATARIMYDIPEGNPVPKEQRSLAKNTNFLMSYGGGADALARNANIPLNKAKEIIDLYFKKFPGLDKYFKICHEQALRDGYISLDSSVGRISHHPDYKDLLEASEIITKHKKNGSKVHSSVWKTFFTCKGKIERDSQNYRMQSTGASMIKLSGIYFRDWIITEGYSDRVKMVGLFHDEWAVECDTDLSELVSEKLVYYMEKAGKVFCKKVRMSADVKISNYWTH